MRGIGSRNIALSLQQGTTSLLAHFTQKQHRYQHITTDIIFYMNDCVTQAHDSLYLVDGNIALVAPHTAGTCTIFRVHQSILAKNSAVFGTMFSLPTADVNDTYEGAPLLQLVDGAEDIESLLRILYHEW